MAPRCILDFENNRTQTFSLFKHHTCPTFSSLNPGFCPSTMSCNTNTNIHTSELKRQNSGGIGNSQAGSAVVEGRGSTMRMKCTWLLLPAPLSAARPEIFVKQSFRTDCVRTHLGEVFLQELSDEDDVLLCHLQCNAHRKFWLFGQKISQTLVNEKFCLHFVRWLTLLSSAAIGSSDNPLITTKERLPKLMQKRCLAGVPLQFAIPAQPKKRPHTDIQPSEESLQILHASINDPVYAKTKLKFLLRCKLRKEQNQLVLRVEERSN